MERVGERRRGRNEISIRVLNHPRDICVHIDVFSEGDTVGGCCARERASSSPPRSLHRNYSTVYWSNDSQARGSQNPSLKQPSLFPPRSGHPFVSRRRKSPATEKGHPRYSGNNNRRWRSRRRCVCSMEGKTNPGKMYTRMFLFAWKNVISSIFDQRLNFIIIIIIMLRFRLV